jgi:endo-alpha-1,4-polygalactosaminidase (GH114 family)
MVDYKVSLTTKLKPPQKGFIVIEPEDYTSAEVKAIRDSGAKVLAYLSIGSISDEREYYGAYKKYALKRLENWPHERYMDLRIPKAREWCVNRALMLRRMGFDGLWLDNVDIYEEYRTTEMFNAIVNTLMAIKAIRGYVMINGGSLFLTDLMIPHKVQLGAYKNEKNA